MEWGPAHGVPVIALHGWLDNAASFTLLARYLPEVRLIALDLAGHGHSDHKAAGQPYYSWDHLADVAALLDALDLKQTVLMGHSLGAGVATLFAGAFPERVSQLILLEGLLPLDYPAEQLPELMATALRRGARVSRRSLKPYHSVEQAVQARMNSRWPLTATAATWLVQRGVRHTPDGWVWRADIALTQPSPLRLCEQQLLAFIKRLCMPILLIMADQGEELALIEPMLASVPRLTLHTLVGGHHLHLEEAPARQIGCLIRLRLGQAQADERR